MNGDARDQLDDLAAQVRRNTADISALKDGAAAAHRRADDSEARADAHHARADAGEVRANAADVRATSQALRLDALEARAAVDEELIRELRAEGLLEREHSRNLELALQTSRMVGAAIGIIMASYGVTEACAMDLLRTASSERNVKLHDVAEDVVTARDASDLRPSRP